MIARLTRLALAGDGDASQRLAHELRRLEDWPALRRLARILIDAGAEPVITLDGEVRPLRHRSDPDLLDDPGELLMIEPVWTRLCWDDRLRRLYACDCAERVLPFFEAARPDDQRPRRAIETARKCAEGLATDAELSAARYAARYAARDAAWYAAGDAARDAAGSAAGSAARDAAGSAARDAAWYAAGYAAGSAARAAAWYAARDAESAWQADRLLEYLLGEAP